LSPLRRAVALHADGKRRRLRPGCVATRRPAGIRESGGRQHAARAGHFPGNNRLDTLENLLEDARVGRLFLVPGVDETLRANGTATVETDLALRASTTVDGRMPITVIRVTVEQAYLHCGKALMRSALWDPALHVERASLPSMGEMLKEQINWDKPAETQAEMLERYRATLY
jgi:hypothetical protein